MRRVVVILGSIVVLLAVLFAGVYWAASRLIPAQSSWPEKLSGVRMEPTRPILRAADINEDNAAYFLLQLTNCTAKLDTDERTEVANLGWKDGVYTNLEAWLAGNEECFALCARIASMTNAQVATTDSPMTRLPAITPILQLMKGYNTRIRRDAAHDNWPAVVTDVKECLSLSRCLDRGGCLIERLVSIAGVEIVSQTIRLLAIEKNMPGETARELDRILEDAMENQEPFAEAMRYEWLNARWTVNYAYSNASTNVSSVFGLTDLSDSNWWRRVFERQNVRRLRILGSSQARTLAHLEAVYSHMIDSADDPDKARALTRFMDDFSLGSQKSRLWLVLLDDPIGRVLISIIAPSLELSVDRNILQRANLEITRVVLAVRQYRTAHAGALPESLGDLVPDYLGSVPVDPFRAKSNLLYRAEADRWIVYSVGPDGDDDGGQFDWNNAEVRASHTNDLDAVFTSDGFARQREKYLAEQEKKSRQDTL